MPSTAFTDYNWSGSGRQKNAVGDKSHRKSKQQRMQMQRGSIATWQWCRNSISVSFMVGKVEAGANEEVGAVQVVAGEVAEGGKAEREVATEEVVVEEGKAAVEEVKPKREVATEQVVVEEGRAAVEEVKPKREGIRGARSCQQPSGSRFSRVFSVIRNSPVCRNTSLRQPRISIGKVRCAC